MSLVEQELLTLPEHLSSSPVFSGIHVARSLVFYVMFCKSLFVFVWPLYGLSFEFTVSDYPFWYLYTFLLTC
jgi:hypothetical protein